MTHEDERCANLLERLRDLSWLHVWEISRFLYPHGPLKARELEDDTQWITAKAEELYRILNNIAFSDPTRPSRIPRADASLWSTLQGDENIRKGFQDGYIQFSLSACFAQDRVQLAFSPPSWGPSTRFYRLYGSDRFIRLRLDDKAARDTLNHKDKRKTFRSFLEMPLFIMGRTYRAGPTKDGMILYFAETGPGLETVYLDEFLGAHLPLELNPSMSVAKYAARFALGLSRTFPTVLFERSQLRRIPDISSDSLQISHRAMKRVARKLELDFVPSTPDFL